MEEDKIKALFKEFDPEVSPDYLFMNRLRNNLDSVEMIREKNHQIKAEARKAQVIAAIIGFVVGVVFSLALPYIGAGVKSLAAAHPDMLFIKELEEYYQLLTWIIISGLSIYASVNVYDLALALFKSKGEQSRQK